MTAEEKVLIKIREVLIADSVIKGYTADRVYSQHVSTINDPESPAISLHLLTSGSRFAERGIVDMVIQIDIWLPNTEYTPDDLLVIAERIRALLDRQDLKDSGLSLTVMGIGESTSGPIMFEEDTNLHHYPTRYSVSAI